MFEISDSKEFEVFSHVSVGVNDVEKSCTLYDEALGALGFSRVYAHGDVAIAYGAQFPEFWVQQPEDGQPATAGNGTHVCFEAKSREAVNAFYEAAMAAGASDAGPPGLRPQYMPTYYAAFVRDFEGNKIEAVCMAEE